MGVFRLFRTHDGEASSCSTGCAGTHGGIEVVRSVSVGGHVMVAATQWHLRGKGYEFCNCDFGCGCNFAGFPNSEDGSCRAFVGMNIAEGGCGDVDLSGVKCAAIVEWPK